MRRRDREQRRAALKLLLAFMVFSSLGVYVANAAHVRAEATQV
jgi:hypothetical protein